MLSNDICKHVLTVGCLYNPPKGGVAQVMYTYSKEVYPFFRCVINSGNGGLVSNSFRAVLGLVNMFFVLCFNSQLRIVHIHTASYRSFQRSTWFVKLAKIMDRKVVLHIHGGGFKNYYKTKPEWVLKNLKQADCIIALTEEWKLFFAEELSLHNVVIVQNIIPKPRIRIIEGKDNRIHLLFLGAINEQKGIFDLLEVINEEKTKWAGRLYLHIGGNQEVNRMQAYINDNELDNIVKYEGWVDGDKKIDMLNLMDAFILPSYIEGLPISILEALSYGKPVITTPVGGIPAIINESNGFLFEQGDKEALKYILTNILSNTSLIKDKTKAAKESVVGFFPESISQKLNSVYCTLLYD